MKGSDNLGGKSKENMMFKFKQFNVKQAQSAMKIGTDGVLLGAWTPIENPKSILDIGAGTGLLSLMLAQRSDAPFYTADYKTAEKARNTARFTDTLSFSELLEGVSQLLTDEGVFSVILPYSETEGFIALASGYGLFPQKITHTRGNATAELKRSMLLLSRKELSSYPIDVLIIEKERGVYTEAYKSLTKDFYLNLGNEVG